MCMNSNYYSVEEFTLVENSEVLHVFMKEIFDIIILLYLIYKMSANRCNKNVLYLY